MTIRLEGAAFLLLGAAVVLDSGPMFFAGACLLLLRATCLLWLRVIREGLTVRRGGETRSFFGADLTIEITVHNNGVLPVPWLRLRETLPPALALPNYRLELAGLPPHGDHVLRYRLPARRRGLHPIGPLSLTYGDPLGLAERSLVAGEAGYVLVYPRIVPLDLLGLPAAALLGTLRAPRPLLGDPSRVAGVRSYVPGDPVHDVHWRATAALGYLQVKQYEPATELQTMLFLDLDAGSYQGRGWRSAHAAELAITCAASVAWALGERRQAVGLVTTGALTLARPSVDPSSPPVPVGADAGGAAQRCSPGARASAGHQAAAVVAPPRWRHDGHGDGLPLVGNDLSLTAFATEPAPSLAAVGPLARLAGGVRLGPAKGRSHTMHLLEALARLDVDSAGAAARGQPFAAVLTDEAARLPWGAAAVVITGAVGEGLWISLHRLREAGARVLVLLVDEGGGVAAARGAARLVGVSLWPVWHESDLEARPS